MSKIVNLHSIREKLAADEQLRLRALAPQDFPFDGLDSETAVVLDRLGMVAEIPTRRPEDSENPIDYGGEAS